MPLVAICNGATSVNLIDSTSTCTSWEWVDASGIPGVFDLTTLDPVILANAFGSGFVLFGSVWLMGWSVRVILTFIKR